MPLPFNDWLEAGAAAHGFALAVDGRLTTDDDDGWRPGGDVERRESNGHLTRTSFIDYERHLRVVVCDRDYTDTPILQRWVEVENVGDTPRTIGRIDSLRLRLRAGAYRLHYYKSTWGQEFTPQSEALSKAVAVETRSGRSSNGCHPWFMLERDGGVLTASIAWPANHISRFEPDGDGWEVTAGLNDWEFSTILAPGETFMAPSVLIVAAPDRDAAAQAFHAWGRHHAYPRTPLAQALPVEWNHWWPYEDKDISDAVFRANTAKAAQMGCGVVTLDAGWFGTPGSTDWWDQRGDWDLVNTDRFPHGIRPLADNAHAHGLKFGIWCEIEAIGSKATINQRNPDYVAMRDGKSLGCACFGNPKARRWAMDTLNRLITEYKADWIKIDWNVDPGAGCNRTDHGHGAGDGLYRHCLGLFEVVRHVHAAHPGVVLEGCSSGGQRIDLAWLQNVPCVFLSDPDYPVHDLQLHWGAMDYVAPNACLHWWWSQNKGAFVNFDPSDPALTEAKIDYIVRTGMLGMTGMSQKLPDLPERVEARFRHHIQVYRRRISPLVRSAIVHRLTGQPLRDGGGDRWCAFQYVQPNGGPGALFAFRLPGGEPARRLKLRGLKPNRTYRLDWDGPGGRPSATGAELMGEGLEFKDLPEEGSTLVFLG